MQACKYNYDYIGKLETFQEDVAYIMSAMNVTSLRNYSNDNDIIVDEITRVYHTILVDKLVCSE